MFTASHDWINHTTSSHLSLSCYVISPTLTASIAHIRVVVRVNLGFVFKTDKTACRGPTSLNTQIKTSFDFFFFFCCKHHVFLSSWGHFCVMWFIHTPLTPLMLLHLWICSDSYPCQALFLSRGGCLSAAETSHKVACNNFSCRLLQTHTWKSHTLQNAYTLALWVVYLNSCNKWSHKCSQPKIFQNYPWLFKLSEISKPLTLHTLNWDVLYEHKGQKKWSRADPLIYKLISGTAYPWTGCVYLISHSNILHSAVPLMYSCFAWSAHNLMCISIAGLSEYFSES